MTGYCLMKKRRREREREEGNDVERFLLIIINNVSSPGHFSPKNTIRELRYFRGRAIIGDFPGPTVGFAQR